MLLGAGLAVTVFGIVIFVNRAPTQNGAEAAAPPIPSDLSRTGAALVELIHRTRSLVAQVPDNPTGWLELGMVYESNESWKLARECYEQAVVLDQQCVRCWYRVAMTRREENAYEPAIEAMRRVITLQDDYAPAHWGLGFWLLEQGDLDQADVSFKRSTQIAPRDPAGWFGLAQLRLQLGRNDEVIRILESVRDWTPVNRSFAQLLLGTAYRRVGRLEEAERALAGGSARQAAWIDPWSLEIQTYNRGLKWKVRQSVQLLAEGRIDVAIDRLNGFLRSEPDNYVLLGNLAIAYRTNGQLDRSIETLQRVVALRQSYYKGHFNLGLAYFMKGQQASEPREATALMRLADDHAERTLSLNPSYASGHGLKGLLHERRGEFEAALSEYRLAAKEQEGGRNWLMSRCRLLASLNRWEDTIETLEELMNRYEPQPDDMFGLFLAQINAGRTDESVQTANRYLQRWPDDARAGQLRQALQTSRNNQTLGPQKKGDRR